MNDLILRLRTVGKRSDLDAEIAAGADPSRDPALGLRAQQLTGAATRTAIATTIHHLIEAAEEPPEAWRHHSPRPPLQREAVLAARAELQAIADRLCGPGEISPRVAALAAQLVWDSGSPVYADTGLSLRDCATAALNGRPVARAA
jgi:hypothetical protein